MIAIWNDILPRIQQYDIWTPTPEKDVSVNVVYREQ